MADGIETEVKIELSDRDAVRRRLEELGARRVGERELEDNVLFDGPDATLSSSGCVLRVRRVGARGRLTYKGPRAASTAGVRTRVELETGVDDPDRLRGILEALGYRARFRYQKYRETWSLGACEVVLDDTPIGSFLEIEGAEDEIHRVARDLGFSPSSYVNASYPALFFERGGRGDMVFP